VGSPQKSELKILIASELGADIEDGYEGQLKAAHELHGGADALKQASVKVPATFIARINKDLDEGKIGDMTALEAAEYIKKYLARVGDYLGHLADVMSGNAVSQFGRAEGMKTAMGIVEKMRREENEKLLRVIEEGDARPKPAVNRARKKRGSARERKAAEKKKPAKKAAKKKG